MAGRDFVLPDLGEGLEDAEVVTWRVSEGDRVELNQVLVEVNTAKALVEIPAPWAGVVERLYAHEGDVVAVGAALVSIRVDEGGGEAAPRDVAQNESQFEQTPGDGTVDSGKLAVEEGDRPKRQAVLVGYGVAVDEQGHEVTPPAAATPTTARAEPVAASPPVRRLAKELGVDLAAVTGSGPGGRVTREDVLTASEAPRPAAVGSAGPGAAPPAPTAGPGDQRIPLKGVRRLTAQKMARAASEIPHVTTFLTVDASSVEAFRKDFEAQTGTRITALPIVVRALAEVVREHRSLNASFDADASEIVLRGDVHVGIATDTERGLLVPVVRHVDRLGLQELATEIARLVQAAREGRSTPDELTGSTVTVTNVGSFGAEFGTPIINHPESSILAIGVIEPRALVVAGAVEARPAATLSLSFDHRVLDGAEAGRALRALGDLLESPFRLGALPR